MPLLRDPVFMPLTDIHKYGGIVNHIKNNWWTVDPEKGLVFYPYNSHSRELTNCAPQCNINVSVARRLAEKVWPGTEVRFIESVLVPIDPKDYT